MSDLQEIEEQFKEGYAKVKADCEKIDKKDPSQRDRFIQKIDEQMRDLKDLLESFGYHLYEVPKAEVAAVKKKQTELENQYEELQIFFKRKQDPNYQPPGQNPSDDFPGSSNSKISFDKIGSETIKLGKRVQDMGISNDNSIIFRFE
jgi:hypothetical protein